MTDHTDETGLSPSLNQAASEVVEVIEITEEIILIEVEVCEHREHHPHHHHHCKHRKHIVEITVDCKQLHVHRGKIKVAKLKELGGVPLAVELDQLICGKLTQLPDNGEVCIKGGEKFCPVPKAGSSS